MDLQVLAVLLPTGDVSVVRDGDDYYLTAPEIDNPPQGVHYYDAAASVLQRVNGLARASDPSFRPVSLNGKYGERGSYDQVISPKSIEVRTQFGTPTVTVTRPDGTVIPAPPSPWPNRFAVSDTNADVAEALAIMASAEPLGWDDLWKLFEIIREAVKPATIVGLGWITADDLNSFKESSNHPDVSGEGARHARRPGTPQHRAMPIAEGRSIASGLVTGWLKSLSGS